MARSGGYSGVDAIGALMEQLHDSSGNLSPAHQLRDHIDGDRATARTYVFAHLQAVPDDPATWVEALGITTTNSSGTPTVAHRQRRTTQIARVQSGVTPAPQS